MSSASEPPPLPGAPTLPHDEVGGSFGLLVGRFYQPLHRFALGLTRNASQAADLTQQTFYLWALRGHQLRDQNKVKGWLYTTLYREFLREVRRKTAVTEVEFDEGLSGVPTSDPWGAATVDGAAALRTLRTVTEPFRTSLLLFYLEGCSYEEIAGLLAVPVGTVMSRLSRGRRELRARLCGGQASTPSPQPPSPVGPVPRPRVAGRGRGFEET